MAFQRARADDPNAILVYNDFNIETVNAKSDALFNLVTSFQQQGIPIDAIGLQMHLTSGGIDTSSLAANMQRFAQLGLQIYITEMDVRFTTPMSATDLQTQAIIYGDVLNTCLQQPACKGLQTWGFTDKYSWIPGTFPGMGQALEFDTNYAAKPAYFALQSGLSVLGGTPGFSLSAGPASASVNAGGTVASTITVTSSGGFTGSVALTASGLPSGVTAAFSPVSATGTSTLTFTASSAAAAGTSVVTVTGTSGSTTHATTITLTVTAVTGTGTGGVTVSTVINSNSAFFNDEGTKISNTGTLTALTVTINIQATTGVTFSGQYNTVGGSFTMSHSSSATAITYQYTLGAGQTLAAGTGYLFDAQAGGNGTVHPVAGDTYAVTYTTGGQTFSQTGQF